MRYGFIFDCDKQTFLEETILCIKDSGHTPKDIVFIGSSNGEYACSWNKFKELANKKYDNGFGMNKVADNLIIVFSDGQQMWRGEYDGSEWWEYCIPFKKPEKTKPIKTLFAPTI
jgi:hypothetical protein